MLAVLATPTARPGHRTSPETRQGGLAVVLHLLYGFRVQVLRMGPFASETCSVNACCAQFLALGPTPAVDWGAAQTL